MLSLVLLSVALFLWFYSFPQKVEWVNKVVIHDQDHAIIGNSTLAFEGTIHQPLFRQRYFEGKMEIPAMEFTKVYKMFPLYGVKEGNIYSSFVTYSGSSQQLPNVTGVMFHNQDFSKINLFLREAPYEGTTRSLIQVVSPATDVKTSEQIVNDLRLGFPDMPDAEKLLPQK